MPVPGTCRSSGEAWLLNEKILDPLLLASWSWDWSITAWPLLVSLEAFSEAFVESSSIYVKSDNGRGPVWLRELRILCKLCKLWTERRSSKSSRVDLNALITRSCKNREGCSIRRQGSRLATHKHAVFVIMYLWFVYVFLWTRMVYVYFSRPRYSVINCTLRLFTIRVKCKQSLLVNTYVTHIYVPTIDKHTKIKDPNFTNPSGLQ